MATETINIESQIKPFANFAALPVTGVVKTIYITTDNWRAYYWDGSQYQPLTTTAAVVWGAINGNLSDQTDLQNALDSKLNKSGSNADQDIDIGNFSLNAKSLHIKGTGGAGHLGLKHQSSNITAATSESTLGANSSGNPVWKNDGNAIEEIAFKSYVDSEIDAAVVGLLDDRGNFDASGNVFPSSGGSGTAGAILKGDLWTISVAGTLGGTPVSVGDVVRALVDTPGQTAANWSVTENNIGYVPENNANKTDTMSGNTTSSIKFLSAKGVYDWVISLGYQVSLTASNFGSFLTGLSAKTTPVDADEFVLSDSAASNAAKKVTGTNLKAYLKTYFDTIYTRSNLGVQSGEVIVTSGTSFTTPSNITTLTRWKIILIGGGGGGGGMNTANQTAAGGGGGGCVVLYITGLTPSTTYTCAIGSGGAGGAAATIGTAGGNTTLTIGATTYTASGGGGGAGTANGDGGSGGTGTNGTINISGQSGGDSAGASAAATDGVGGNAPLGLGIGGNAVRSTKVGQNATGFGGGGSGGKGLAVTGGNGSNGIIIGQYTN